MSKQTPRRWTVLYRHPHYGMTQEGTYTNKDTAVSVARTAANKYGVEVRVSTRGHFGSLTVTPEVAA